MFSEKPLFHGYFPPSWDISDPENEQKTKDWIRFQGTIKFAFARAEQEVPFWCNQETMEQAFIQAREFKSKEEVLSVLPL